MTEQRRPGRDGPPNLWPPAPAMTHAHLPRGVYGSGTCADPGELWLTLVPDLDADLLALVWEEAGVWRLVELVFDDGVRVTLGPLR